MHIADLQEVFWVHPNVERFRQLLPDTSVRRVYCGGMYASSMSLYATLLMGQDALPAVFVMNDVEEAGYFYHDMVQMVGDKNVLFFPSSYRHSVKYRQVDTANEILRTEVLGRLQKAGEGLCIITYPDALSEQVVNQRLLKDMTLTLKVGEQVGMSFVSELLQSYGFKYVDYVYEPGQYAIRGSIIDVFSYSSEYPFRIDFFGDEVESLRMFEVESQLSREQRESIVIVPELSRLPDADASQTMVSFLEFLPAGSWIVSKDFLWVGERLASVVQEASASSEGVNDTDDEEEEPAPRISLVDARRFMKQLLDYRLCELGSRNKPTYTPDITLAFDTAIQPAFHKNFDMVSESVKDYISRGYTIYICSDSTKQTDRIRDIFQDRGDDIAFMPVERTLHEGFIDNSLKVCVFTDHQLFDRYHKYTLKSDKAHSGKVTQSLKELNEFQPGDYVVHTDHGVGRFAGLVRLPNGNTSQEVMKIVYQNQDVVFVSIHSLHKVSKYKGKDGEEPRLSKLGTGAWEKLKERTKRKIKDIARDLIKLYAARREEQGFQFSPDSFMQKELEASFLYEDTPDQSKATAAVKADMESKRPMDRLICGDVGFGKTEVAIRAAFKAVADNKQVAVLVPTTVLAFQHYQTFRQRLKGMPCRIDYLTRARTGKQIKETIQGLASGQVNILIGTQRMLGKDVSFKDLGLLIIDEEQKFGVSTKEKLRQMRVNVDTLTLSATPIPRTLQFSLMGARDMSIIQTAPPNRYPIQTELHTFGEEVIKDAIEFEMNRDGQVFFVNNRISRLPYLKELIERHVPGCRVAIGHGQMEPAELEQIVLDFINYDYDVLLSTTIIENGIDIPNANTIIINEAHNFGLSDLHQMRGRVGRSNRKAFCYLLAPSLSALTDEARRRLQAIENFSGLGSGIQIAMQDLDIRGAGNLLGAEQSGFIADLGYETYQKILAEAVRELKTSEFSQLYEEQKEQQSELTNYVEECQVESDLELLLPATYVTGSAERMALYRELDNLTTDGQVQSFRARLIDRFGIIPPETEGLLQIVPLQQLAIQLGVEKLLLKGGQMTLYLVSQQDSPYYESPAFGKLIAYMMQYTRRCDLRERNGKRSMLVHHVESVEEALYVLREVMDMQPE